MNPTNFQSISSTLQTHGYVLMFILLIVEGPIVASAAAFLAYLGYFNIFIVILLAILGDIIGDIFYFYLGRYARHHTKNKKSIFGVERKDIDKWEDHLDDHFGKSMFAMKLAPVLGVAGLIAVGMSKISSKRFLIYAFLIAIPKVLLSVAIGYYFGYAFESISKTVNIGQWLIAVFLILVIAIPLLVRWIISKYGFKKV